MDKKYKSEIDINLIRTGNIDGQYVWICDFRQPDFNKKPIRKILPQKVLVRSNDEVSKRIFYSQSHFAPLNKSGKATKSKTIAPFDNTGYRSYAGVALRVFKTEHDCKLAFSNMCAEAMEANDKWIEEKRNEHKERSRVLVKLQSDALISLDK